MKMTKKTTGENLESKIEETIEIEKLEVEETKTEEVKTEEIVENKSVSKGTRYTVYRNEGNKLFLVDSKENGLKIPTPEQYKNAKKGDIVYL